MTVKFLTKQAIHHALVDDSSAGGVWQQDERSYIEEHVWQQQVSYAPPEHVVAPRVTPLIDTTPVPFRPRFRLRDLLVRMWRLNALLRMNLPVAVFLNRFAAPRCVFSFGMMSFLNFARWGPLTFPTSLRARGRLRRLPSGARLRPQALLNSARWGPLKPSPPRCALAVAFGDFPPALACGRRRFSTPLGGTP